MKNFGLTSLDEYLGDYILFRKLEPLDDRLPSIDDLKKTIDSKTAIVPRKKDIEYARIVVALLNYAQKMHHPRKEIRRLVSIGDTMLNDGTAFLNICEAGGWQGFAFIASEDKNPQKLYSFRKNFKPIYCANRWQLIDKFHTICKQQNFPIDEQTAVIFDLDKTAIGARGRNSRMIDRARLEAVQLTVTDLLGAQLFDPGKFQNIYNMLNRHEFHFFTTDNQDYLAYICLILGTGLYHIKDFVARIQENKLKSFEQFIHEVDEKAWQFSPHLRSIHTEIYQNVLKGDPTPFKMFRANEYKKTVEYMGNVDDNAALEFMLLHEILITQEVRRMALQWKQQGALLFGLSDKPDEASLPPRGLKKRGYLPIHKLKTHAVGE